LADRKPGRISQLLGLISNGGGVALSNTYKVTFEVPPPARRGTDHILMQKLKNVLGNGFNANHLRGDDIHSDPAAYISLMCDEAILPGVQAATGQLNGIYTGSGQYQYPHTRIYNDLTLSWICDANMTPLKFLDSWMEVIFNEYGADGKKYNSIVQGNSTQVLSRNRNRSTRLSYPDSYTMQLSILKAERDDKSEVGRASIRYVFDGVYPYAVESIPLSFGSSQLVKVRANFYYEKWFPYYDNIWKPIA
jgi:hypothetical protein